MLLRQRAVRPRPQPKDGCASDGETLAEELDEYVTPDKSNNQLLHGKAVGRMDHDRPTGDVPLFERIIL